VVQELSDDELLVQRLPLALTQLYRRAQNAKSAPDRHFAAYYLWEAALKLLGSVCVAEYSRLDEHDPQLRESLVRLGHSPEMSPESIPIMMKRSSE